MANFGLFNNLEGQGRNLKGYQLPAGILLVGLLYVGWEIYQEQSMTEDRCIIKYAKEAKSDMGAKAVVMACRDAYF